MLRGKLQSELFYCNHLGVSDKDEQDIMNFTIRDEKGAGLLKDIQFFCISRRRRRLDENLHGQR